MAPCENICADCLRFASPAEALGGLEAWRLRRMEWKMFGEKEKSIGTIGKGRLKQHNWIIGWLTACYIFGWIKAFEVCW